MAKKTIVVGDVSDPPELSQDDIKAAFDEGEKLSQEFHERTKKMQRITTVDSLERKLNDFIAHTEARLYSIRQYLATVKLPGGYRLFTDEDLAVMFGKSFEEK